MTSLNKLVNNMKNKMLDSLDNMGKLAVDGFNKNDNYEIIEHTVEKGDTLYMLSKKYDSTVQKIIEANGPKLAGNPNLIVEGQVIKIPSYTKKK